VRRRPCHAQGSAWELKDEPGADSELGQHVDQSLGAEEIDPATHEVADSRLSDAQQLSGLALLELARRNRPLEIQQQVGTNPERFGLVGREAEVSKHVTGSNGSS